MIYLDTLRRAGRWEVLVTVDPTDEDAHLRVITALARRGQRAAARRQYERLEDALRHELGISPSPAAAGIRARLFPADAAPAVQLSAAGPVGTRIVSDPRTMTSDRMSREPVIAAPRPQGSGVGREPVDRSLQEAAQGWTLLAEGLAEAGATAALLAWLERTAVAAHGRAVDGTTCADPRCLAVNPFAAFRGPSHDSTASTITEGRGKTPFLASAVSSWTTDQEGDSP